MSDFETVSTHVAVTVAVKTSSTASGTRHPAASLLIETRQDPRLLGANKKATRFRESLSVVRPKGFEPLAF
ncbi:hypothetical protein [Agreia bicolorata]|uniref:hypothetical protein n=1 Tax=Agreia bicolorata TaxID=110935 RepID=UPI00111752DA|nr:hypothetical protein [Agreia bicolorata]